MKTIAKIFFIIIFLFSLTSSVYSQRVKNGTKMEALLEMVKTDLDVNSEQWVQCDWQESYATIVHKRDSNMFIVYDNGFINTYDITKTYDKRKDEDGDITREWDCVSENGERATIKLVILKSSNREKQLYIELPNKKIAYHLK